MARKKKDEIKQLEDELQEIDSNINITDNMVMRKSVIQNRLSMMYDKIAYGAVIRSRVDDIVEENINTNFFKGVEQNRQGRNVIDTLLDGNGDAIRDQDKILEMIGDYYGQLYNSGEIDKVSI